MKAGNLAVATRLYCRDRDSALSGKNLLPCGVTAAGLMCRRRYHRFLSLFQICQSQHRLLGSCVDVVGSGHTAHDRVMIRVAEIQGLERPGRAADILSVITGRTLACIEQIGDAATV